MPQQPALHPRQSPQTSTDAPKPPPTLRARARAGVGRSSPRPPHPPLVPTPTPHALAPLRRQHLPDTPLEEGALAAWPPACPIFLSVVCEGVDDPHAAASLYAATEARRHAHMSAVTSEGGAKTETMPQQSTHSIEFDTSWLDKLAAPCPDAAAEVRMIGKSVCRIAPVRTAAHAVTQSVFKDKHDGVSSLACLVHAAVTSCQVLAPSRQYAIAPATTHPSGVGRGLDGANGPPLPPPTHSAVAPEAPAAPAYGSPMWQPASPSPLWCDEGSLQLSVQHAHALEAHIGAHVASVGRRLRGQIGQMDAAIPGLSLSGRATGARAQGGAGEETWDGVQAWPSPAPPEHAARQLGTLIATFSEAAAAFHDLVGALAQCELAIACEALAPSQRALESQAASCHLVARQMAFEQRKGTIPPVPPGWQERDSIVHRSARRLGGAARAAGRLCAVNVFEEPRALHEAVATKPAGHPPTRPALPSHVPRLDAASLAADLAAVSPATDWAERMSRRATDDAAANDAMPAASAPPRGAPAPATIPAAALPLATAAHAEGEGGGAPDAFAGVGGAAAVMYDWQVVSEPTSSEEMPSLVEDVYASNPDALPPPWTAVPDGGGGGREDVPTGGSDCKDAPIDSESNGGTQSATSEPEPSPVGGGGKCTHLIVLTHGYAGSAYDMRLLCSYLQVQAPRAAFLISQANQQAVSVPISEMAARLASEVDAFIKESRRQLQLEKLSFVCFSISGVVLSAALALPAMAKYRDQLHTLAAISSPLMGLLMPCSTLTVSSGLWFFAHVAGDRTLRELCFEDKEYDTPIVCRLHMQGSFPRFRHVILVGSHQDKFIPLYSSHMQPPPDLVDTDPRAIRCALPSWPRRGSRPPPCGAPPRVAMPCTRPVTNQLEALPRPKLPAVTRHHNSGRFAEGVPY